MAGVIKEIFMLIMKPLSTPVLILLYLTTITSTILSTVLFSSFCALEIAAGGDWLPLQHII